MYPPLPPPPMLIDCSHCRIPLSLPPGAQSVRCAICFAVTQVAPYTQDQSRAPVYNNQLPHVIHPPSPTQHSPVPPNAHGSKKAVIIGVSYSGTSYELKGCLNDAKCMKFLLTRKFNFPESSILLLTGNECMQCSFPSSFFCMPLFVSPVFNLRWKKIHMICLA